MKHNRIVSIGEIRNLLVYNSGTGELAWRTFRKGASPGDAAGRLQSNGQFLIIINGKKYQASHIAWAIHTQEWPKGQLVHINGNVQDNRICNLQYKAKAGI